MTNWVYAERPGSNTIFTIDPAALTLGPTITLPAGPATPGVNDTYAMTPDLSRLVVGVPGPGSGGIPSAIYEIDTASNTITHTYTLPGSQLISGLVGGIPGAATNLFAYFACRSNGTNAQIAIVDLTLHSLTLFAVPNTIVNGAANLSELIILPDLSEVWCPAQGIAPNFFGGILVMDTLSVSPSTTFIPVPLVAGHNSSVQQPIATPDSKFVFAGEGNANTVAWKFDVATKTLDGVSPIALSNPNGFNLGPTALDLTNTNYYDSQSSAGGPPFGLIEVVNIGTSAVTSNAPGLDNANFATRKTGNSTFSYFMFPTPVPAVVIVPNAAPTTNTVVTPPFRPGYCEVSTDGKKLWISSQVAGSGVMVMDTTLNTFTNVTFPTGLFTVWNTAGNGTLVPPVTLSVGHLFIPRKGFTGGPHHYTLEDLMINWRTIETWARTQWSPPVPEALLISPKLDRLPTPIEINADWQTLEIWSKGIGTLGGFAVPVLTIPRRTSMATVDLDTDFLAIQSWANALP